MRARSTLKFVFGIALGVVITALTAFNLLLLWVATGPRSLEQLTPAIEESLKATDGSYNVKIGQTWLVWDGWEHPLDLRLRNVSVLTKDGEVFSVFPEISLGVDVLSLPRGRFLPVSLTIIHPVISLFQNEDHSISFGFSPETSDKTPSGNIPFSALLAPLIGQESDSSLKKLRAVSITDADVSIGNSANGVFFKTSDTDIHFKRKRDGALHVVATSRFHYDQRITAINAQFDLPLHAKTISGDITFSNLQPAALATMFMGNNVGEALKFPMNGKIKLGLDTTGYLRQLDFNLAAGEGRIESDKLAKTIPVTSIYFTGSLQEDGHKISVSSLSANLDGMKLEGKGNIASTGETSVEAELSLKNIPATNVSMLWPPEVSPQSREWITTNILDGMVPLAQLHVNIAPGDLSKPVLPKEAVNASILIENAKIRYLPEHPEVSNVKGEVHVDALTLSAKIESGDYMTSTRISKGELMIEDLNADNPYIKLDFDATSSAKDIVRFLGLPKLGHAARLNLSEKSAAGMVSGHAKLGFSFFAPRDAQGNPIGEADVDFDITGNVKDIAQSGFMNRFDISAATGEMAVNNKGLEFKGKGKANGADVSAADIRYLFKPEQQFDTFIDVQATAPVESLPRFGYPAFPFLKGALSINANVKQGAASELSQATIDLTNAGITLDSLKWSKPDKEPAILDLAVEKKDGAVSITSLHLKSAKTNTTGHAALNKDLSDFKIVTLDRLTDGQTDIENLVYEPLNGGFHLEFQGKAIDISPWMNNDGDSTFSFEHFPALRLKMDVNDVILGDNRRLKSVKGQANCTLALCDNANISGKTPDNKPFFFRIQKSSSNIRQLAVHAENAGAFLQSLNILDGMEGGELVISGSYDDSREKTLLAASASMNEYVIKGAPVLARILSLASLTGFFDTLQGKGIRFTKLNIPFTISNDVVTLKDAKTHGPAIGMTANGTITFPGMVLALEGTVVPSYTLNSVLGNVPILGNVLTGGEGQGVFAARYNIKGTEKKMDVNVNPLSMLTPGFLRGMFDIFDKPAQKTDDSAQ